ncbi:tripartite tricarboxylate transporter substrate binding protein [Variovorax robiniae]|uniref:Tripartite tricarboxylate transporter substrate binding protein n=1 Tax=Variovorax robiniae TaxID=1836199 RepID=A0ABU8XDL9_9BURK
MRRNFIGGALAAALVLAAGPVLAQKAAEAWPARPIKWIVPYQAGSAPDASARVVAEAMAEILHQPVIVDNKPGAGGNVGTQMAAHAPADGYTWLFAGSPTAAAMRMYKAPGFDALKDFTHVSLINMAEAMLVVPADSSIRSAGELLASLRQNPDKLSYGSGGVGTPSHLATELMLSANDVKAVHVPYKGAASIVVATIGKEVDFSLPLLSVAAPQVQGGKLRALAVTGAKRSPKLPDVPTMAEAGLGQIVIVAFGGLSVPVGTPAPIVARINAAVRQALDRPEVRGKLEAAGASNVAASTPEQFTAAMKAEIATTERMMVAAKLEVQ